MKKQSLIKGSLVLGIAAIFAKFLGLFFRWPLIMLIGDEGIGYYQMTYPLYMFFVAIASGVPVAISKLISERNARGKIEESFQVVKESAILMLLLGTGTTMIFLFLGKPIISMLKWDPKSYYALLGISFAPLITSIITIFRGFFQGFQNMTPTGISQILEQVGRVVIGVGLAVLLLPYGIEFSAGGAAFGAAAGGLIGVTYLGVKYARVKKQMNIKKVKTDSRLLTEILKMAIPISIGTTVGSIMSLIDSVLVPQKLLDAGYSVQNSTILYAQLTGKASVIVNIPLTISMAIGASLIPIIAECYALRKSNELNSKINLSLKMSTVIGFPCTIGIFLLANPIMNLIFPGKADGGEILKYLAISIPFIIITQTTTSILQGVGHYILPVVNLFIGCAVKVALTLYLVPMENINIYGAVIASIIAYMTSAILNVCAMKIKIKSNIQLLQGVIKPLISSIFMGIIVVVVFTLSSKILVSNGLSCLLAIFMGIIIYIMSIIILRVFSIDEIKNRLIKNN